MYTHTHTHTHAHTPFLLVESNSVNTSTQYHQRDINITSLLGPCTYCLCLCGPFTTGQINNGDSIHSSTCWFGFTACLYQLDSEHTMTKETTWNIQLEPPGFGCVTFYWSNSSTLSLPSFCYTGQTCTIIQLLQLTQLSPLSNL